MKELLIGIVYEGIKLWNQERRLAFQKKYNHILSKVSDAENALPPDYTDAALMLSQEELENFMQAYYIELKAHNAEVKSE